MVEAVFFKADNGWREIQDGLNEPSEDATRSTERSLIAGSVALLQADRRKGSRLTTAAPGNEAVFPVSPLKLNDRVGRWRE
jgi:hypothetical protein